MIILASNSPRRQQLLTMMGISFKVQASQIDESLYFSVDSRLLPSLLSEKKALDVFFSYPNDAIIGADTIVVLENKILEKPKDEADCYRILRLLSNKTHEVITAVTILYKEKKLTFSVSSMVTFYPLTDKDIAAYIQTKEPFDKAGAYAIQGFGAKFIKHIKGDYYAIMGLPIAKVYWQLKKWQLI